MAFVRNANPDNFSAVNAGDLNRRLLIKRLVSGVDAAGQPVGTWTDFKTAWGSLRHKTGKETMLAGANTAVVQATFRLRYTTGITSGMRVYVTGDIVQTYNIISVIPSGANKDFVDLLAETVNAVS